MNALEMAPIAAPSAEQLGIRQWEYDILQSLIEPLRSGALKLNQRFAHDKGEGQSLGAHVAELHHHPRPIHYEMIERPHALKPLYIPGYPTQIIGHPGFRATGPQGAEAIERFLLGQRPWDFMLSEVSS